MNPMFLSHLQSMQTKSQGAQNPGLWVNGNRMPMHENSRLRKDLKDDGRVIWTDRNERVANKVDSMYPIPAGTMQNSDLEKDRSKAFWHLMKRGHPKDLLNTQGKPAGAQDLNADGQVSKAEKELSNNPEDLNYDPGKALGDYADSLDEAKSSPEDRLDKKDRKGINPKSMLGAIIAEFDRQQAAKSGNPKAKSDAEEISNRNKSMQENTNRSMFLTHLQGMQTKSQGAQNPGLWVNGNRMPIQETSNQRRADYLLQVSGVKERTPGSPPRSMRKIVKRNSGRGANLAFQGEDGQGIPANLLGGPNMKNAIATELGVPNGIVYPNNKYLKEKPTIDLNLDGQVSKAEQELTPMLPVPFFKGLEGPNRGRGTGYWASTQ